MPPLFLLLLVAAADAARNVNVSKCCPFSHTLTNKNKCVPVTAPEWNLRVYSPTSRKYLPLNQVPPNWHLQEAVKPPCSIPGLLTTSTLGSYVPFQNGSLFVVHNNKLVHPPDYCIDYNAVLYCLQESKVVVPPGNYYVVEDAGGSPKIMIFQENVTGVIVEKAQAQDVRFIIYPIGLALGAVFLAATLAAGAILPASHHVLHWRCQTNYVACLLGGDVLLCITHLSGRMDPAVCVLIAVSMHFLFLAAFFWLNTMCFNIWWTFRDLRPQSVEKSQERCRLRLYMMYAWGVPFIIAATAAILDSVPDSSDFLRPKFGVNTCWFYGKMEILTFFYGPIGVLLMVNLALFALTARELTCGLWKRELVKSTSERAALGRVCMKLVVVMGVSWIADVLSWAVGGPQELWYLTDLINCLQGLFIFIVVGCQPQVLSAAKRLWCSRMHRANGTAGTTNHQSYSSQGLPSMGDTVTNHSVTNNTKSVPLETSC
ncbi:probable G-protein coupled receptor Mth-like 1 [Zophobas morio]|uniref:probable G-protein coupled receptor Mth-like 1 n=1 Tax=Zophobas morio TaxID=2755281 RepID=UPI003083D059